MTPKLTVSAATVAACLSIPATIWSADPAHGQQPFEPTCAPFAIERHLDRIAFIDQGEEGVSVGDRQVLRFDLLSHDGALIGSQQVMATVVHGHMAGAYEMMIDGTVILDDGMVRVSTVGPLRDPADTSAASADTLQWAVDDGTGTFAGAFRTMTTSPRGDGAYDVDFEISCPG